MKKYTVNLSDQVTYLREVKVVVSAPSKEAALRKVLDNADNIMSQATFETGLDETQIDNEPYNADIWDYDAPVKPHVFHLDEYIEEFSFPPKTDNPEIKEI